MKNYALLAIAAVGMLAACSKNEVTPQTQPDVIDSNDPVAVEFGLGNPAALLTKGSGTVGGVAGENNWTGEEELYILGFRRLTTPDYTNAATDAFMWQRLAEWDDDFAGGSADTPTAIKVTNPDTNEPYYYGGGEHDVYDFYGYHVDDAYYDADTDTNGGEPVPVCEADRIYVPVKIDGSQDLLVAKADPATDIQTAIDAGHTQAAMVAVGNAYSAYAARRGVQPNLNFRHKLARFTFQIIPGSASADEVQVSGIRLESKTDANLVVVGAATEDAELADIADAKSWLDLRLVGGGSLADTPAVTMDYADYEADAENKDNNRTDVGESILAIPGEAEYQVEVTLTHRDPSIQTDVDPVVKTINIANMQNAAEGAPTDAFAAGYSYNVVIKIYGLEEVEITVTLDEWKDGGETIIDPDDEDNAPTVE